MVWHVGNDRSANASYCLSMSLNFGKFDQKITVSSYSESEGTNGESVRTYSTLYTLWARITPGGGAETQQSNEKVSNSIIDVEVRAVGLSINETMRIGWDGKDWNITSINRNGTRLKESYLIHAISKDNS